MTSVRLLCELLSLSVCVCGGGGDGGGGGGWYKGSGFFSIYSFLFSLNLI